MSAAAHAKIKMRIEEKRISGLQGRSCLYKIQDCSGMRLLISKIVVQIGATCLTAGALRRYEPAGDPGAWAAAARRLGY